MIHSIMRWKFLFFDGLYLIFFGKAIPKYENDSAEKMSKAVAALGTTW